MKTALVFGATGQTGDLLTDLLLEDIRYESVVVFVRKPTGKAHVKLKEVVNPLTDIATLAPQITEGDVFCCLGTTIAKAGSQAVFKQVDYDLPVAIAKTAATNGIKTMVTITAVGSDAKSRNFYLQTKGEAECDIAQAGIKNTVFVRPSMLLGDRKEFRLGEMIGKALVYLINPLMVGGLKHYKGIQSKTVAKAMIALANDGQKGIRYIENEVLFEIGK